MKNPCIRCPNNRQACRDACTICDARMAWVKFNAKDDFDPTKEQVTMPDTTPETKICSACKLPKPLSEFRKHSQSPDGHVKTCNDCRKPTPGRKPTAGRKHKHVAPAAVSPPGTRTDSPAYPLAATQAAIAAECDAIKAMLLAKNAEYGDSAVHPVRIFSTADPTEQIRVRIDDKISRLAAPGKKTISEDTVADLIGYLVLLRVAEKQRRV